MVDLGVGLWAWPLPMDYDDDGDLDLVVSCPDVPFKGTYLFENPGGAGPERKIPGVPSPATAGAGLYEHPAVVRRRRRPSSIRPPVDSGRRGALGRRRVARCRVARRPFIRRRTSSGRGRKLRANQWQLADFDGDGRLDLIVGVGDWADYGWDNAFDRSGRWTRGPLHGWVYLIRNHGSNDRPRVRSARADQGRRQADRHVRHAVAESRRLRRRRRS